MFGNKVVKSIDNLKIEIAINGDAGKAPMVYKSACTAEEIKSIGTAKLSRFYTSGV